MIKHTLDYEVEQILSTFAKVSDDFSPKLTFVNVHKKINTRLFAIKVNIINFIYLALKFKLIG